MLGDSSDVCAAVEYNHSETDFESNGYLPLTIGITVFALNTIYKKLIKLFFAGTTDQSNTVVADITVKPFDINALYSKRRQGCDNTKMFVPTSDMGRYKKRLCCFYCMKRYVKLARHLTTKHKHEEEVKYILALPVGKIHFLQIIKKRKA